MLADILKSKVEYKEISREIHNERLGHAYVIIAQDEEVGREFFKLVCRETLYKYGLTDKENINYKIDNDFHPDIILYKDKINVALLEEFVMDVYKKGMESEFKLYLFDTIETPLEVRAQNKMLKVYEEPPKNVAIFILTKSESTLLQTINSRAKKIYLPPLETEEIEKILMEEEIGREKALSIAKICNGSIVFARMLAQKRYIEILDEVIRVVQVCEHSSKIASVMDSLIFDKENINITLDFLEIILMEKAAQLSGKNNESFYNQKVKEINGFSLASIAISVRKIIEARKQLKSNVNALSVAETLMLNILEAKYKWQ